MFPVQISALLPEILLYMLGMVITAVAPLRESPSHRSEMVNQLLFGELMDVGEAQGDFVKIRARFDGYEGWCQRKQLVMLEGDTAPWVSRLSYHTGDWAEVNGTRLTLSPGSTVGVPDSQEPVSVGPYKIRFGLSPMPPASGQSMAQTVIGYARLFLGTPYLWGGRSRYGIDCSGLTQTAFRLAGLVLPRDSGPQSREGTPVDSLDNAKPGDLAFFAGDSGKIVHVGILLSPDRILHASAVCRIDPIDSRGIKHAEEGDYTHRLAWIKRFF